MAQVRVHNFSVSLDGFGTGEGQSSDAPFGHAGGRLMEWFLATRTFHAMHDKAGGDTGVDEAFASNWGPGIGAEIMGRNKFGQHPHPLQRRLAGVRRAWHRHRPDLRRPRRGHPGSRLGRRDPPAQPGRRLTAYELGEHGVPAHRGADNAGGHLMQQGQVDLVHRRGGPHRRKRRHRQQDRHLPQGARRHATTACRSTWRCRRRPSTGRSPTGWPARRSRPASGDEVTRIEGVADDGSVVEVRIGRRQPARNPAFDVTPARLVTGLITERRLPGDRRGHRRTLRRPATGAVKGRWDDAEAAAFPVRSASASTAPG